MTTVFYLGFPFLCILALPPSPRRGGSAARLVFGLALYQLLLLATGLCLGLSSQLTPQYYRLLLGVLAVPLAVAAWRHNWRWPQARAWRGLRTRRGAVVLLLLGLAGAVWALELGFDFCCGTRHGDGLWYHIPRVVFWLQQGNFAPWETPVAASIGLPVGADLVLLHRMLLGLGWNGAGYVTALLAAGAAAAVYLIGSELGLRRWHAILAALLFASFPAIGLRLWSVNSDLAAAFPVLAAVVALLRLRDPRLGLAAFLLLCGVAFAAKPTVAPPALLLAGLALWRQRERLPAPRQALLPALALLTGAALVIASYWPVCVAFGDPFGGDYSRLHRTSSGAAFLHAVGMHATFWLLEPLGYLTRFHSDAAREVLRLVYNQIGASFTTLPAMWQPYPGQDSGYTGLAPALALPLLFAGLPAGTRRAAGLIFLLGFIPLSGMISPQPYFTRYNLLLLAGVALLWGGTHWFARGRRRWLLAAIVALNLAALFGVAALNVYLQQTRWSQPGGRYHYLTAAERTELAQALRGRPLLLLTESSEEVASFDALLPGPQLAFPLRYVICPADGDWEQALTQLAGTSNRLALIHNGRDTLLPGPDFPRPGLAACGRVARPLLEAALTHSGWVRDRSYPALDLWRHP